MRALVPLVLAFFLAACDTPPALVVTPDSLALWSLGQQARLSLSDENGTALTADRWESADPGVATVDDDGLVTARGVGETRVSVWLGGRRAEARVVVDTDGVVLSGRITFPDRLYDEAGFTGAVIQRPVRHARVAVLDASDQVRAEGFTDGDGRFDLGRVVPTGLRLVVYSAADDGAGYPVEVARPDDGALIAAALPLGDAVLPLEWSLEDPVAGAFNILDVLLSAWDFSASLTTTPLPPLSAYWAPGGSTGTYYCTGAAGECPQGRGIYVLQSPLDTDGYDDDVLWHEFGHFLSNERSRDTSPGGCHFLESLDLDLRLAWSEGWGDFFPAAVKAWLAANHPERLSLAADAPVSLYVDTDGSGQAQIAFDVAAVGSYYRYASNELAVASLLWQLQGRYGMAALWRVLEEYLPIAQGPVNLETLWDGWLVMNPPGGGILVLESLFAARAVEYRRDPYEGDDDPAAPRLLTVSTEEARTLYGVGDVDIAGLALSAGETVTVRTTGLTNGADTQLRVYDPDGLLVADNDDDPGARPYEDYDPLCGSYRPINDAYRLASKVTLQAQKTGTYRIEVSTTLDPDPYPSAGRYGGYRLQVTSP